MKLKCVQLFIQLNQMDKACDLMDELEEAEETRKSSSGQDMTLSDDRNGLPASPSHTTQFSTSCAGNCIGS
jgi:hypothetical protein